MRALPVAHELDEAGQDAFRRAAAVVAELGEDVALCTEPLMEYARAFSRAAQIRRDWNELGSPTVAIGSTGQVVSHPLLAAMEKAERFAHELGAALGLSPQARHKLSRRTGAGRPPGAASARDRAAGAPPARRSLRVVS